MENIFLYFSGYYVLLWMSNFHEDDKANIRQQIIPHVRFGRMSVDFFLEHLANNSIIDKDLSLKVLIFLSSVESQDIPDHCIQERCLTTQKDILIRRFTEHSHNSTWPVENTINGDRISFSLNLENLRLRGVYVLVDLKDSCQFPFCCLMVILLLQRPR